MTRLLDVMEDYLVWKKYKYLRLDGHTSGQERGALIDKFNNPNSQAFIFLLRYVNYIAILGGCILCINESLFAKFYII